MYKKIFLFHPRKKASVRLRKHFKSYFYVVKYLLFMYIQQQVQQNCAHSQNMNVLNGADKQSGERIRKKAEDLGRHCSRALVRILESSVLEIIFRGNFPWILLIPTTSKINDCLQRQFKHRFQFVFIFDPNTNTLKVHLDCHRFTGICFLVTHSFKKYL